MALPKFKQAYDEMLDTYKEDFDKYVEIQELFKNNHDKYREDFNSQKQKLIRIIRRAEDRLCSRSENTKFSRFSQNLSDKFWEEIRTYYPQIDYSE